MTGDDEDGPESPRTAALAAVQKMAAAGQLQSQARTEAAPHAEPRVARMEDYQGKRRPHLRGSAAVAPRAAPAAAGTLTEDAAALAFAARHKGRLLHCHDHDSWFIWSGTHWKIERTDLAFDWARDLVRELAGESASSAKNSAGKTSFASGVERSCRSDRAFAVTSEVFDADPFLLGTPGGTVDLRTGKLRPADPDDRISKVTASAPALTADCPRWHAFLVEATGGDRELIRFLQQWCGYGLTGDTREHALIFVYGPGGNGKSVFLNSVSGIMGDYAATAAMDTFTATFGDRHPTDLAMLRGARIVTASETEEGRAWAESRIKQITGGDPISARFMRQDFFTYLPTFKLTVVGNHKPVLHNVDDAARRRFNIVPFIRKPPVPDKELEAKLRGEWPAILRWMIDGCLDWQRNGLQRAASVTAATDQYFSDQDLFGQWLDEECDAEPGNDWKWEATAKLFAAWSAYAQRAGEKPGSKKAFSENMQRRNFHACRKERGTLRAFSGIRLRHPGDQQDG
jgi:putative DNA primase/helicase